MDLIHVIVLALIQGLTEFLPISSSAHLILPSQLLGWPDQGLAFDLAVHVGTLTAVVFYFRQDLWKVTQGWVLQKKTGSSAESRLGWNIIIATIPVCIAGFFGKDFIEQHLRSTEVIAITTLLFGVLLWWADWQNRHHQKTISDITFTLALIIGLAQMLALVPGTSRSGITITAALFLGLTREDSARFSFLMSVPTILLGGAFALLGLLGQSNVDWLSMGIGFVCSAASAYICITLFLSAISKIGMFPFVVYRLILGTLLLGLGLLF